MASDRLDVPQPSIRCHHALGVVAGGLQLLVGVPYLFAFLLAPLGVVLVLWATWGAVTFLLFAGWRRGASKPLLLVPAGTVLLWVAVLAAAQAVIGPWKA